jgi:hypothetical protein
MGREGLYFRRSIGAQVPAGRSSKPQPFPRMEEPGPADTLQEVDSGSVLEMIDTSSAELLRELNDKRKKVALLPIVVGLILAGLILLIWTRASGAVIGAYVLLTIPTFIWVAMNDDLRKTTVMFYELEGDAEKAYQLIHDACGEVRSRARTWHVSARGQVKDRKYHAGAGTLLQRQPVSVRNGNPPFVKSNLEIPLMPVGRQILAFMPDRLLVFEHAAVGAVSYSDLSIGVRESRFVEEEDVPPDATVVGTTWRYVNKQGGPDRRFKDNRQIPICLYEELHFESSSGLNEIVQTSRPGVGALFRDALTAIRKASGVSGVTKT